MGKVATGISLDQEIDQWLEDIVYRLRKQRVKASKSRVINALLKLLKEKMETERIVDVLEQIL